MIRVQESNPPQQSLLPNPPKPLFPLPPQQRSKRMMIRQEQLLPPKPDEPRPHPPHCVADKSLIIVPPKMFTLILYA